MLKRFLVDVTTGTADGVTAGNSVAGGTLFLGGDVKKVKDLSAVVTVDAETNGLTFTAKWQGTNDESTWYDIANTPANTAGTAIATGTGGADASVVKAIPAPPGIEGWRYGRLALVVGATAGNTVDTYSIGYVYNLLAPGEGI